VNLRFDEYDVYIGRAGKGKSGYFGNPFTFPRDGDREEVLKKYKKYFYFRIRTDREFVKRLLKLKGKRLGCFCKPEGCHGDLIAEWVNKHAKK
jgi:hypothetical protein